MTLCPDFQFWTLRPPSSLLNHILYVVFWGAQKQVIWIDAWRIVTLVADKHSLWYRTIF